MVWYEQLKFRENPLDSRPNTKLVALEDQEDQIINHIMKEELCFLNGPTGSGKTSLLRKIQEKLTDYTFIYLDADDLPKDFDIEKELKKKRNFFDMITLREFPTKKPVLLIDEFQATDPRLVLKARSKWEDSNNRLIRSIVIAQIDQNLKNATGSFKERLGKRIISLDMLDSKGLKDMLRARLYNQRTKTNYADKFTEDALNLLIKCADNNPRRILEYTDLIFDFHYRRFKDLNPLVKGKDYMISHFVVNDILRENNIFVEEFAARDLRKKRLPFNQRFNREEHKILRYVLRSDLVTSEDIGIRLNMPVERVSKLIKDLKEKEAIVITGRKGRHKLWEVTPGVKRMMIKK
ncbi:MAG: ATP-binding protein [archaeon]